MILSNYTLIRKLGSGYYAKVYLALNKTTHQYCAIKVMRLGKLKKLKMNAMDEIHIQSLLPPSPHVAQLYQYLIDDRYIYLVMEYCGIDLHDLILKHNVILNKNQIIHFFRGICQSIDYCHHYQIIHGDIKPENFGYDRVQRYIKLFDFGLAQMATNVVKSGGTLEYQAPEHPLEKASDIWSAGIILYIFLYNCYPNIKPELIEFPLTIPTEAIDLLKRILVVDPKQRITIEEILRHPYIQTT